MGRILASGRVGCNTNGQERLGPEPEWTDREKKDGKKKEREIPLSPGRPFAPMKAFGVNRSEGEEKVGLLRSVPQNHPGCERRK